MRRLLRAPRRGLDLISETAAYQLQFRASRLGNRSSKGLELEGWRSSPFTPCSVDETLHFWRGRTESFTHLSSRIVLWPPSGFALAALVQQASFLECPLFCPRERSYAPKTISNPLLESATSSKFVRYSKIIVRAVTNRPNGAVIMS